MSAPFAPQLRQYQIDVIGRVAAARAAGHRRILLVAPTGSGKTVIAAAIIAEAVRGDERALFLAHRRELTQQSVAKLYGFGIDAGIIQAGFTPRLGQAVQVASVQTLHARAVRGSQMNMPDADLAVVDEAHHARARTIAAILNAYPEADVLGLTATPCRGDGRGLGNAFDVMVQCPSVAELTAMGYLVPARFFAPSRPDLAGVRVERGDYVGAQLAERMDRPQLIGDVVTHWLRHAQGRRTVVFASGVAHSVHLRDEFRRVGVLAEHVDGSTPADERDAILAQLAAGTVEVVTNAMVLTEGWDSPEVSCLVLARPTKSRPLFLQMVGRGLRTAPGKTDALILDHAGAVFQHGFPDDPIEWTLAEDRCAENTAQKARARGDHHAPALTDCPECHAVKFEGRPCTVCGWQPRPRPAAVDVAEGDLAAVDRSRKVAQAFDADGKIIFYRQLLWIADERGYRPGWAAYKHKEKFGEWPPRGSFEPLQPEPATRSWVRSRQIAYAKAKAKQAEGARP
jgi:DNA repair protein RadD